MTVAALRNSEGQFSVTAPRKTADGAENTVQHRDTNRRDGGESSVVVTTLVMP